VVLLTFLSGPAIAGGQQLFTACGPMLSKRGRYFKVERVLDANSKHMPDVRSKETRWPKHNYSRLPLLALCSLFVLLQGASVSFADPTPLLENGAAKTRAAYILAAYRYHSAECRYVRPPAMDMMFVAAKPSPQIRVVSTVISCLEPGDFQWT
jgi:hypothetical protein